MIPIVIPLHHGGGKHGDDRELRLALRGIERHLKDPFEIVIVGKKLPAWLAGVRHIKQSTGALKSALRLAADAFPAGFFWWYDDCVLLRDQTAEELKVTIASTKWSKAKTSWAKSLTKIHDRLVAEGITPWDYSRPHGPYWFDKAMIDEAFADWPGMAGRFPFESWILSKRDWPRRHGNYRQFYGPFKGRPGENCVYVNFNNKGFTDELIEWLGKKLPRPSAMESDTPVPWPERVRKVEVHTLRFGNPWWMPFCAPTLDDWCHRHGHKLRTWNKEEINPAYPAEKFCEVDMLREFLAGDSELLLYVDADVYVDPLAPPHPEPTGDFLIRKDLDDGGPRDFRRWCKRNRRTAQRWTYRNAGVWMSTREGARRLLEVIELPYLEGCQEQHHFNWWLHQATLQGLDTGFLPDAWNAWAYESPRGAFYHIAGRKKAARLQQFRANGRIPPPPVPKFDFAEASALDCKGKRVAIIGNGPSALAHTEEIDGYDIVVRFNRFQLGVGFEMLGTRTDVLALPACHTAVITEDLTAHVRELPFILDLAHHDDVARHRNLATLAGLHESAAILDGHPTAQMVRRQLCDPALLGRNKLLPTTGLSAIAWFLKSGAKEIYLTGFSFEKSREDHYFKDQSHRYNYSRHCPIKELHWLAEWAHHPALKVDAHIRGKLFDGQPCDEVAQHEAREGKPYSAVHQGIYRTIAPQLAGLNVLEVGGGIGWGSTEMKGAGANVTCVEPHPRAAEFLRANGWEVLAGFPENGGTFDAVTCVEVIEHLPAVEVHAFLCRMRRQAPRLFLSTPDRKKTSHGRRTEIEWRHALGRAGWRVTRVESRHWTLYFEAEAALPSVFAEQVRRAVSKLERPPSAA